MKYNCVIVHYDEIGLKGKNRDFFEKRLITNLQFKLKEQDLINAVVIRRIYGRIIIELNNYTSEIHQKTDDILKNTFGIANFGFAVEAEQDIQDIEEKTLELLNQIDFETFRISASRSDKNFIFNSQKINERIGAAVFHKLNKKVNLTEPDLNCFIEIVDHQAYIMANKINGPGGLPVGVSGRTVCLLSGGIDSPVAAWFAMKRGLEPVYLHFHSYPHTSKESVEKVNNLAKILDKHFNAKIYNCAFVETQKQIFTKIPDKYRIIFYRRFMFRIATKIAKQERALSITTGEAIGQVASQTQENIAAIAQVTDLPIIRPVICFDKKEIVDKAKQINTYKESIRPHDDCCTVFMPKSPETKAKINEVLELEKQLDVDALVEEALQNCSLQP